VFLAPSVKRNRRNGVRYGPASAWRWYGRGMNVSACASILGDLPPCNSPQATDSCSVAMDIMFRLFPRTPHVLGTMAVGRCDFHSVLSGAPPQPISSDELEYGPLCASRDGHVRVVSPLSSQDFRYPMRIRSVPARTLCPVLFPQRLSDLSLLRYLHSLAHASYATVHHSFVLIRANL
jgi:hypothetical protein